MCCGMFIPKEDPMFFERMCLCICASFSIDRSGSPSARLRTMGEEEETVVVVHWSMSGNRDESDHTLPLEP
jgi:hypothetical protein